MESTRETDWRARQAMSTGGKVSHSDSTGASTLIGIPAGIAASISTSGSSPSPGSRRMAPALELGIGDIGSLAPRQPAGTWQSGGLYQRCIAQLEDGEQRGVDRAQIGEIAAATLKVDGVEEHSASAGALGDPDSEFEAAYRPIGHRLRQRAQARGGGPGGQTGAGSGQPSQGPHLPHQSSAARPHHPL